MNQAATRLDSRATNTLEQDPYRSRGSCQAQFAPRHDPVVYTQDKTHCPIDYEFIEQYREQGYFILDNLFSAEEISYFQGRSDDLLTEKGGLQEEGLICEPGSGDVRSIFKVHTLSATFSKLASDRRLAGLAEYILDDNVYIHQSRLNYKPGFRGKEFYWHSDFETWHVEDGMPQMRALSMSILLTDNHEVNGPLMVLPGSHKDYVVCAGDTPADHFRQSLKKQEYGVPADEQLSELASRYGIVSTAAKAGSVVIFDCNLMHGSNSNITPLPRANVFLVYNAVSNRLQSPYCGHPPRPEYIASREAIESLKPHDYTLKDYAGTR